jgi:hypothetical protein
MKVTNELSMKLDKKLIEEIENSDACYIIGVKGKTNFTAIQGRYSNDLETVHHLVQGMLGNIDASVTKKKWNNSQPLMILIYEAIKRFPIFTSASKR